MNKFAIICAVFAVVAAAGVTAVNISKTTVFYCSGANSRYNFSQDFNTTRIAVSASCLTIDDGIYQGSYCYNNTWMQIGGMNGTMGYETNIFIYDEHSDALVQNTTVTLEFVGENYAAVFNTTNGSVHITTIPGNQDYSVRYYANGYRHREYYYYERAAITDNLRLYLINTSKSDLVMMTLNDQYGRPAINYTVKMLRNYISAANVSQYQIVSMMRTNVEGKAGLYVDLYDVWYKFIYTDSTGKVLKTETPSPIFETELATTINTGSETLESFRLYDNVYYYIDILNSSGTIYGRLQYADSSNIVRKVCLDVRRVSASGYDKVCYNCSAAAAGTISCLIDHNAAGTYMVQGWIDTQTEHTFHLLDYLETYNLEANKIYFGREGVFLTIMVVGTMATMGLATATGSIMLMVIGLIGMGYMTFMSGLVLGYIYWIVILAMMILFMVHKFTGK